MIGHNPGQFIIHYVSGIISEYRTSGLTVSCKVNIILNQLNLPRSIKSDVN